MMFLKLATSLSVLSLALAASVSHCKSPADETCADHQGLLQSAVQVQRSGPVEEPSSTAGAASHAYEWNSLLGRLSQIAQSTRIDSKSEQDRHQDLLLSQISHSTGTPPFYENFASVYQGRRQDVSAPLKVGLRHDENALSMNRELPQLAPASFQHVANDEGQRQLLLETAELFEENAKLKEELHEYAQHDTQLKAQTPQVGVNSKTAESATPQLDSKDKEILRSIPEIEYKQFLNGSLSKPLVDAAPYMFFIVEGIVVLAIAACAMIGSAANYDPEDIHIEWYCHPCVDTSTCCVSMLSRPSMCFCLTLYLVIVNFMWIAFVSKAFQKQADTVILYTFVFILVFGLLLMLLKCVSNRIWSLTAVQDVIATKHKVDMLLTFTEHRFGKKFYSAVKNSNEFTAQQLAARKKAMLASGHYCTDTLDDVTDFLGITECSSEDDITAMDMLEEMKIRCSNGKIDQAATEKRLKQHANRAAARNITMKKKSKTQPSVQPPAGGPSGGPPSRSCNSCF